MATFVDAEGRALSLPEEGSARSVTTVERHGEPVAALVHDRAVLDDPGLLEAVSSAAQLAAANARLQAEVRARVFELQASRRRILEAGDEERRRLERRLHDGAELRLDALADTLRRTSLHSPSEETGERIDRAEAQLERTLEELGRLGRGLHPRELSEVGLKGFLAALAARSSIAVTVAVTSEGLPPGVESAVYFVCSEALANVTKYAAASRVAVSVTSESDVLRVQIEDDGVGGADPAKGSGLRGLADRVETLGGTLRIDSPLGQGTRLAAEIPLDAEAP
jgi:signal transduction histidine kinase